MKKSNTMISNTIKKLVETEGASRATGVSTNRTAIGSLPDPEVAEKALCRKFTASYKLRILQEADTCTAPGQMGALLRRVRDSIRQILPHGAANVNEVPWRLFLQNTVVPKAKRLDPSAHRIAELEQENIHLKQKLKQGEKT